MTLAASKFNFLGAFGLRGIFLSLLFIISACSPSTPDVYTIKGEVFGSYYIVKWVGEADIKELQFEINELFKTMNDEFSNYQNDSLISRFNNLKAQQRMKVSPRFIEMLEFCKKIHLASLGAFDPTLRPVIKLWGFGGGAKKVTKAPSEEEIKTALTKVGFRNIQWDKDKLEAWKIVDEVAIDTNAYVPGWTADLIGEILLKKKIKNFMIDISGELLVKGQKAPGTAWVVGIEKPVKEKGAAIQVALKIRDKSIATSGNYRQFFEENGERRSHIIDPRTGKPVAHQVASATVIGKTALETDAWGTAFMVLGLDGIEIADQQGLKIMLLEAVKPGEYREVSNKLMKEYQQKNQVSLE